ncbi:MAG: DUF6468 domain-containing protein [Rhodospirillales bacterium]|nr:DUF6468 domain-containing protein [Rhodospirillales bacterium]
MLERLGPAELGLVFDAMVAVLLVATIVYAVILNRKLTQLRDGRAEMERLLGGFVEATVRAESGLSALREATGACGEELQRRIDKGNAVADDLMFLVERAGALADRLEGGLAQGHTQGRTQGYGRTPDAGTSKAKGIAGTTANPSDSHPEAPEATEPSLEEQALRRAKATPEKSAFMEALRGIR